MLSGYITPQHNQELLGAYFGNKKVKFNDEQEKESVLCEGSRKICPSGPPFVITWQAL